ncbi:MAG: GNAT family N-acetyltransferase [Roseobacter sp.]
MQPEFSEDPATVMEFQALRGAVGLTVFSEAATALSLRNQLYGLWLRCDDDLVGMGRLIGDGGIFAQVTDIAVHPCLQRQGWGDQIVSRLMFWADANLPGDCYISLIAEPGAEKLYARHGFVMRTGMSRQRL